ncbi:NAD(P)H-dependent oxidoreductase [Streptomyces sp. P38-E01]|uniref:FMN dependent NADH:quinone oxidoreductase n=1 Tax=Streptomyces tardus TaxID=2780544 RepID=A0A949N5D6_9ACTN|nr:NAD(P)H-dependent oxidoreductase [Streptomyces tardus]MBU7597877.1 NAD(P)H-dependent oxidoreductase [Streptomyces tardus]
MATLLHIDSSLNGDNSASRAVTALFRETWQSQHPEGRVIYRDLSAQPVPHVDAASYYAGFTPAEERTAAQVESYALTEELLREIESADAVLVGAPLYNFTVPSSLKAWIDRIIAMGRTSGTENGTLAGKPVTVVTSRGGSYAEGTPQAGNDFLTPYLQHIFGTSLGMEVDFIVPELTLAPTVPAMAELIPLFEQSRERAHEEASSKAKALAAKLS